MVVFRTKYIDVRKSDLELGSLNLTVISSSSVCIYSMYSARLSQ